MGSYIIMKLIILAAFVISTISAVNLDQEELINRRGKFARRHKNFDLDIKKVDIDRVRNFKGRHPHRFHNHGRKNHWRHFSKSNSKSYSKSNSKSFSKSKSHSNEHKHMMKRFRRHRFPRFGRKVEDVKILKVGDAQ